IITVLNEIRLKHALALLTQSDLNISVIALECGFNDLSYFYRTFKKKYSFNPGEYKRKFG
ncbi:MAG: helix-turn-helix transcriptional regulator, partial [Lentisphaeria bacterium]|nr:helix-turn-helix transcriptional regulator [Lentisphaeria bacterium]